MSVFATPIFSYAYGPDFDFRSYHEKLLIEEKGADRIVRGFDRSLFEYAETQIELQELAIGQSENIVEAIRELEETTALGFVAVVSESRKIRQTLGSIDQTLVQGFNGLSRGLVSIESRLVDIDHLLRNPEKTWSFEQYNDGLKLFNKGHTKEAIKCLKNAINGAGRGLGVPTEYRFHLLLGYCYLGQNANDANFRIDPERASHHFDQALKFYSIAEEQTPQLESKLQCAAGRSAAREGRLEKAFDHFSEAWTACKTYDSGYELAKISFAMNRVDAALDPVRFLIRKDRRQFFLHASNDRNFFPFTNILGNEREQFKNELKEHGVKLYRIVDSAHDRAINLQERHSRLLKPWVTSKPQVLQRVKSWVKTTASEQSFEDMDFPFDSGPERLVKDLVSKNAQYIKEIRKAGMLHLGKTSAGTKYRSQKQRISRVLASSRHNKLLTSHARRIRLLDRFVSTDGAAFFFLVSWIGVFVLIALVLSYRFASGATSMDGIASTIGATLFATLISPFHVFGGDELFGMSPLKIYYGWLIGYPIAFVLLRMPIAIVSAILVRFMPAAFRTRKNARLKNEADEADRSLGSLYDESEFQKLQEMVQEQSLHFEETVLPKIGAIEQAYRSAAKISQHDAAEMVLAS